MEFKIKMWIALGNAKIVLPFVEVSRDWDTSDISSLSWTIKIEHLFRSFCSIAHIDIHVEARTSDSHM